MDKKELLTNTFTWLFIGLLICFTVSWITTYNRAMADMVFGAFDGFGHLIYFILEIIIALILTLLISHIKPLTAKILYILFTAFTGLGLTGIYMFYTASSLAFVFLAASIIFGAFAIIGKNTQVDLSKFSVYVFVALLAVIVLEIINIFLLNNTLNMVTSIVSILIFTFYTAYDIQILIKGSFLEGCENKGVYCAFQLFLDFINIFIDLLRLFGKSRD